MNFESGEFFVHKDNEAVCAPTYGVSQRATMIWMRGSPTPLLRPYLLWLLPIVAFCAVMSAISLRIAAYDANFTSAFERASVCRDPQVTDCRWEVAGRILRTYTTTKGLAFEVTVDSDVGLFSLSSVLDQAYLPKWQHWKEGDVVGVELWNGQIVAIAGLETQDNPDTAPVKSYYGLSAAFAAVMVALGGLFVCQLPGFLATAIQRRI